MMAWTESYIFIREAYDLTVQVPEGGFKHALDKAKASLFLAEVEEEPYA